MTITTGTRLGPYELGELLGKGGMGEVYLAHDARLNRRVAVKVLPPESTRDPELVRRFKQEAKAASARNHPNILTIYDFGVSDGTCYIATEYVEGHTLRGLMSKQPMPVAQALDIAAQCADGLAAAHSAGIVHRDIKPANIMLRPDGYVKILDFGLAKLAEPPSTHTSSELTALTAIGQVMGTSQYMSPEQSRGQGLDARTDIWSLGTVLYEMVSGTSPFAGPTSSDTMASVLTREPASLKSAGIPAGEALDRILGKALAKDRKHRYQSMADLSVDLRRLQRELEASPTQDTHPPPPEPRLSRAPQKRAWLGLATTVSIALTFWVSLGHHKSVVTPPERTLTYSLLVQKMRDGKPYQAAFRATGRDILENGWKVQFDFSPPLAGSLYLLNEAPGPDGKQALSLVFPTPSVNQGSAEVIANTRVESAWLLLDDHAGQEKFSLVWATHPVPELEQARTLMFAARQANEENPQIIRDPHLTQAIPALLANSPGAAPSTDPNTQQTTLQGHGDILVSNFELDHR